MIWLIKRRRPRCETPLSADAPGYTVVELPCGRDEFRVLCDRQNGAHQARAASRKRLVRSRSGGVSIKGSRSSLGLSLVLTAGVTYRAALSGALVSARQSAASLHDDRRGCQPRTDHSQTVATLPNFHSLGRDVPSAVPVQNMCCDW